MISHSSGGARRRIWLPRTVRFTSLAKVFLLFIIVVSIFAVQASHRPHATLDPVVLVNSSEEQLIDLYEDIKQRKAVSSRALAEEIRASATFPNGDEAFQSSTARYTARLRAFVNSYFADAPTLANELREALNAVDRHNLARSQLPPQVWSRSPAANVRPDSSFELWKTLVPKPLPADLARLISPTFSASATAGGDWDVKICSDDIVDASMSLWTGQDVARGASGTGQWTKLWARLSSFTAHEDLFRYMTMLAEGGIYADADVSVSRRSSRSANPQPIAHPYLWGNAAESELDPNLEAILQRLSPESKSDTAQHDAVRHASTHPPHMSSILNPEISLVVAIEWDRSIAWNPWKAMMWTPYRWRRAQNDGASRRIQFSQYVLMAKPHHPIFLDTLATIAELAESGGAVTGQVRISEVANADSRSISPVLDHSRTPSSVTCPFGTVLLQTTSRAYLGRSGSVMYCEPAISPP